MEPSTVPQHLVVSGVQAAYIRVPHGARGALAAQGLPFRDGLHAASHALVNVLPLFLMCNAADLGTECDNPYDTRFRPERLLVYDKHPGGIGLAKQARMQRPPPWQHQGPWLERLLSLERTLRLGQPRMTSNQPSSHMRRGLPAAGCRAWRTIRSDLLGLPPGPGRCNSCRVALNVWHGLQVRRRRSMECLGDALREALALMRVISFPCA